ncbi:MAG: amidoligase family protein [Desulfarculus sp.]|nr:amidoligase family protein [Desulfarculus sp.]
MPLARPNVVVGWVTFGLAEHVTPAADRRPAGLQGCRQHRPDSHPSRQTVTPVGFLNNGLAVVSPPLERWEGLEAVRAAITALDEARAPVGRACGLHVHFDAANLGAAEIKMIVLLCLVVDAK